ncbi:exodeoxyribonuclease VII small subunit [uncultured Adlercreutzia sp.]|uniref:exodeoxyribonuclease VII small subunit n=1 Tax=uncultured Adlercreutzia sp. TaxID=875803 RepID=UPI0025E9E895|nr:exodeoxyribonuclease VII small subunit [uncultured Adlercreutzia sp.]
MADEQGRTFEAVHERLSQIVDEVAAEDISLDEALKLYEEAVKLGLSACDLSEQDIDAFVAREDEASAESGAEGAEAQEVEAEVGDADAEEAPADNAPADNADAAAV